MAPSDPPAPSPELTQAELDKAAAEARSAVAAAAKAEREEAEASSPIAVARRAQAADLAASKETRESLAAALPDLSRITRGDLAVTNTGDPTGGTSAAGRAITKAAAEVAEKVVEVTGADDWSLLVTSDPDLVAGDGTLRDVNSAAKRLKGLADDAQEAATTALGALPDLNVVPLGPILAGAAQLLPGILSLLSPPKTLTTGAVSFDDTTATIAVIGALKGKNAKRHVFHQDFRLLPATTTAVETAISALETQHDELAQLRTRLQAASPKDPDIVEAVAGALALVSQVVEGIDAFTQALSSVPPGATRSARTTAILQEAVNQGSLRILLVKAQSASGSQLVTNNLVRSDKFSVLAIATISWALLDTRPGARGEIAAAGLATGTAHARGELGKDTFVYD